MELLRELAIGLVDLVLGGALRDTQDFVRVFAHAEPLLREFVNANLDALRAADVQAVTGAP